MKSNEGVPHENLPGAHHPGPPVVFVPLDGSTSSATALPVARTIADILGGTIHLVHIAEPGLAPRAVLEALGMEPGSVRGLVVSSVSGPPAQAIVDFAEAHSRALITMCTQGWTSDPRVALGSVAEDVLRHVNRPLVLVGPEVGSGWEPNNLSRVLIPLDGSPATAAALGPAAELVERAGAALDVLHVIEPKRPTSAEPGTLTAPQYTDQPHYAWPAWRREFVQRFCDCFSQAPERLLVAVGDPGEEIVRAALEQGSQLIVLAWKGDLRGNHARAVRTVLSQAPCPVLCLRVANMPVGRGSGETTARREVQARSG